MTLEDLLVQLEREAAMGWPEPWWPQDVASTKPWDAPGFDPDLLDRLIGLLADAHTEARKNSNNSHLRSVA